MSSASPDTTRIAVVSWPADAVVDAVPGQRGQGEAGDRVEGHQQEAEQQWCGEGLQQPAEAEALVGGADGSLVDVGRAAGRRQGVDLGEQFR